MHRATWALLALLWATPAVAQNPTPLGNEDLTFFCFWHNPGASGPRVEYGLQTPDLSASDAQLAGLTLRMTTVGARLLWAMVGEPLPRRLPSLKLERSWRDWTMGDEVTGKQVRGITPGLQSRLACDIDNAPSGALYACGPKVFFQVLILRTESKYVSSAITFP